MELIKINSWSMSVVFIAAMSISTPAAAIPSSVVGDGIIWSLDSTVVPGATSASFTLSVDVSGWTDPANTGIAYLSEFSLKNFDSSATISNLVAPTGSWDWINEGLNADGCKDIGTPDALCIMNTGAIMDAPSTASNFTFTFDIALEDVFPDEVHLKVHWVDADGNKIGSLISRDLDVPEPGVLLLMSLGLAGLCLRQKLCTN